MREVRASAPGKVNLTLRVGPPTPDGYHPLTTVFQAVRLIETVTARRQSAQDHGTVTLTLERHQERLRLAVHNTGEPIPPEHLPHLFERFYRADAARNRSGGGYGLGLAIAHAIAEEHGGNLSVASTQAEGTVFTATLPLK